MQLQEEVKSRTVLLTSANYFTIAKFRYSFISKLISSGHRVVLYSSYDEMSKDSIQSLEKIGAICLVTGSSRGSYSVVEALKYIKRYNDIIKKYSVNIVINFTLMPMILGGIVCRYKKLRFVSVVTGLGSQYHGHVVKRYLLNFFYNLTVKYSNQIWFVSQSDASVGEKTLNLDPNKIKVVYGAGIKINPNKNSIFKKNSPNSPIQIIYMGRIRKDKGIEDFIALAQKLAIDDRFSLVLMGSMDSSDQHIKDIVSQATKDNLITRIDFNYDNLKHLSSSDVMLLCSRHEGMPTVVIESMAHYVVPIAASIEVIEELNNMGAKIYSYKPGNIASLYEKIIEIEGLKPGYRDSLLEDNYKFVSKYFDQDEIAKLQYKYLFDFKE